MKRKSEQQQLALAQHSFAFTAEVLEIEEAIILES